MMPQRAGFSLVEILVSVFVFAAAGIIASTLLNASLTARDINRQSAERAEMTDRARMLMREDFGQLASRPARLPDGRSGGFTFRGSNAGLTDLRHSARDVVLLAFTRAGRPNPGQVHPRGSLQYVEYVRDGDRLIRRSWSYPDRVFETPAQEFVLLEDFAELEVEFLNLNSWVGEMASGRGPGAASALPRAVRLATQQADGTALEFVLLTPEFPS
ncbi:type II secretion system minor pseudopilin GspJ [Hyphobacterium sp.]|uniref:type II secretion system minor pseudopilin GspJ n=1 Tax=Hyphobacterium sp. TaxID=2004662 RepID=UPI003BABD6B3